MARLVLAAEPANDNARAPSPAVAAFLAEVDARIQAERIARAAAAFNEWAC